MRRLYMRHTRREHFYIVLVRCSLYLHDTFESTQFAHKSESQWVPWLTVDGRAAPPLRASGPRIHESPLVVNTTLGEL